MMILSGYEVLREIGDTHRESALSILQVLGEAFDYLDQDVHVHVRTTADRDEDHLLAIECTQGHARRLVFWFVPELSESYWTVVCKAPNIRSDEGLLVTMDLAHIVEELFLGDHTSKILN